MKTTYTIILLLITFTVTTFAKPPVKYSSTRYRKLWQDSPFTEKPIIKKEEKDPLLNEWLLSGVSGVGNGYTVMLMKKKDRKERVSINNKRENAHGFSIISVKIGRTIDETVVKLRYHGKIGELRFDRKALTIKNAPKPLRNTKNTGKKGRLPNGLKNLPNTNSSKKKKTKKASRVILPKKK